MTFKRNFRLIAMGLLFSGLLISCDDEDDDPVVPPPLPPVSVQSIDVTDQMISRNMIKVNKVILEEAGWLVVHRDNGNNAPVVPDIISSPIFIPAGTTTNVMIEIHDDTLTDGEKLWIMAHKDNGDSTGVYEFRAGNTTEDVPVMVNGVTLMKSLMVTSPSITVNDQSLVTITTLNNDSATVAQVEAKVDGWVVIHYTDANNDLIISPIAGKRMIMAGTYTNLRVPLDSVANIQNGDVMVGMLHINGDGNNSYDFPNGADLPEIFSNPDSTSIILDDFMIIP
jgi:hypothetical protein